MEREREREREIHARTRPDTHGVPTLTIASTVLPLIIFAFLHYTPLALLSLLYKNHFPFFLVIIHKYANGMKILIYVILYFTVSTIHG